MNNPVKLIIKFKRFPSLKLVAVPDSDIVRARVWESKCRWCALNSKQCWKVKNTKCVSRQIRFVEYK